MIDRPARDRLVHAIEDYLDERTTAFAFDEAIFGIAGESEDETVDAVAHLLWTTYDDCTDHPIVADKPTWDWLQRLIVLLKSDEHLVVTKTTHWSLRQLAAMLTCGFLAGAYWWADWSYPLLLMVAVPVSLLLAWNAQPPDKSPTPRDIALLPFTSVAHLRKARRETSHTKRRFPRALTVRRIRSEFFGQVLTVVHYLSWIGLAPLVLLTQTFPRRTTAVGVAG